MARRVAIVTPYHGEPLAWIAKAHASVLMQTHAADHVLVADGRPEAAIDAWDCRHIVLPRGHRDWGHTPRAIGALAAVADGYDAIGFLDADNWLQVDHVASLIALAEREGADLATSLRNLHHIDGRFLRQCALVDGIDTLDTNCMLFQPSGFAAIAAFALVPIRARYIADRWVGNWMRYRNRRIATTGQATVAYRVRYRKFYEESDLPMPPDAAELGIEHPRDVSDWWKNLSAEERRYFAKVMGAA